MYVKLSKTQNAGGEKVFGRALAIAFPFECKTAPKVDLRARLTSKKGCNIDRFLAGSKAQKAIQNDLVCRIHDIAPAYVGKNNQEKSVIYADLYLGDLYDIIIEPHYRIPYFKQMMACLKVVHDLTKAPLDDVKPHNFLINHGRKICVTDLSAPNSKPFTKEYIAPERLFSLLSCSFPIIKAFEQGKNVKSDVWSLGVCFYYIENGRFPNWVNFVRLLFKVKQYSRELRVFSQVPPSDSKFKDEKIGASSDLKDAANKKPLTPLEKVIALIEKWPLEHLIDLSGKPNADLDEDLGLFDAKKNECLIKFFQVLAHLIKKKTWQKDNAELLQKMLNALTNKLNRILEALDKAPQPKDPILGMRWRMFRPKLSERPSLEEVSKMLDALPVN